MLKFIKENKKLVVVATVIILIIIALIVIVRDKMIFDTTEAEEFSEYYAEETIRPRNLGELYGYNGANELNDLYMGMNSFVSYIAKLKKNTEGMEAEELKQFFSTNQAQVLAYTGISKADDFVTLVEYIREYKVEEEFKYAEVVANSSYKQNNYYWAEINFYYGESNQEVSFFAGLAMKSNNKTKVRFSTKSTDTSQEEYERKQNLIQQLKENDSPGGNAEY